MSNFLYDSYIILTKIYGQKAYIKQAINSQTLNLQHKALTVKTVYGVIENDTYLDYIIKNAVDKPPKQAIKIILKQSIYLIKFVNKPPYAVTNEAVDLAKKLGKGGVSGFINAVIRKITQTQVVLPSEKVDYLSIRYSYPKFAVEMLIEKHGAEKTEKIISFNTDLKCIRLNGRKSGGVSPENLIKTPFQNVFFVKKFSMDEDFGDGSYTVQSIGSIAVCDVVEPCLQLLDACAAPGGKSVYLSEKCQNVTAFELHPHRLDLIKSYAQRMGADNIECMIQDSSKFNKNYFESFDGVLCDVPCSGLGVAHENPDIKLNREKKDIAALNEIQLNILKTCAKYLKNGGFLYYSTCSVLDYENDGIIEKFLKTNGDFEVYAPESPLDYERTKYGLQFLPHISLGAGFYVCKLKKVSNEKVT